MPKAKKKPTKQKLDGKIKEVPTQDLKPNAYNPNQQTAESFELLIKSIQEDGFTLPILVNSGDSHPAMKNMIADGEHRWRAATVIGMPTVPVIYKDLDEAGMRTATIRHNLARGHHDAMMEANVLKELVIEVGDQQVREGLNIDPVELDVMMKAAEDFTSMEDLAELTKDDVLEHLGEQGLEGDQAEAVARRHAMIDRDDELRKQDGQSFSKDKGKNVRIEFVYAGEQSELMREVVGRHKNAHDAILELVKSVG